MKTGWKDQMENAVLCIQNLLDAGCPESSAAFAEQLYCSGQLRETLQALKIMRCNLMDELHKSQRNVDCLDYMIRQTEQEIRMTSERENLQ